MSYLLATDQYNEVHGVTAAGADGAHTPGHTAALDSITALGRTARTLTLATHPANWRPGRILNTARTEFIDPPDTHPPLQAEARREKVVRWARRQTGPNEIARGWAEFYGRQAQTLSDNAQPRPHFMAFLGLALVTTAAAKDDDVLNNAVAWPSIERNIEVTMKGFLADSSWQHWEGVTRFMLSFDRFYMVRSDNHQPAQKTALNTHLASGRSFAEGIVFARRAA